MKTKLVYILLLSIFYLSSQAEQQYKSVLNNGMARWSVLGIHEVDGWPTSNDIIAANDTLINGFLYKNLFIGYFSVDYRNHSYDEINILWQEHTPELDRVWENMFMRESEDFSKLYVYDAEKKKEYLISDLSLEVGDKFEICYPYDITEVITVDSVYIENNLKHVRFANFENYYIKSHFTFIESVGPDEWFLYPFHDYAGVGFRINCFKSESTFYKSDIKDGIYECPCGYWDWHDSNTKGIKNNNFNFTVKPDWIEVFFSDNMEMQLLLYNLNGTLLYRQNTHSQNTLIPTNNISNGVYLLEVLDENNNKIHISKIII